MYPIKETREVNCYCPMIQGNTKKLKNICISKDGKEIVSHWDGYYYVNANNTISKRRYKL